MTLLLLGLLAALYFGAAFALFLYGLNAYVMIFLFLRRTRQARERIEALRLDVGDPMARDDMPEVVTQLPIFNEFNVAERAMRAAAAMQWPAGRHLVQVLDDSTDECRDLVDRVARDLRERGCAIQVVRREERTGWKAGALANGMTNARGDIFCIFDADFAPPRDFLLRSAPFFTRLPKLGLVQARWGHLNRTASLLTRAQSMGIDGHFMVEQSARDWNNLLMNFNGTAGLWRRQAIEEAGGWHWDTLTEDMDLSYRMQLAGWSTLYLQDLVAPAEVPEQVTAFKSQQFRWAKGSIQTARKLLPRVLRARLPLFTKVQAFFHLTHYMVHPLMLCLALLALPVLLTRQSVLGPAMFAVLAGFLALAMCAPSALYVVSQRSAYKDWPGRILWLPALVMIGVGLALSNSRAVFEAFMGKEGTFVRTPKRGDKELRAYRLQFPATGLLELALGAYCCLSLHFYLRQGAWLVGPFLGVYSAGFLFIGALTLLHGLGLDDPRRSLFKARKARAVRRP